MVITQSPAVRQVQIKVLSVLPGILDYTTNVVNVLEGTDNTDDLSAM